METPLVSICSITYNHAPFIRQCLDGFLMQQCNFPIEIIINDDCSTDGTTEIIREYAERYPDKIFPVFHTENQWSKGEHGIFQKFVFPKARGKYIALCEGDDYWTDPLKLQKQVDFLESHPDYSMCFHKAKVCFNNNIDEISSFFVEAGDYTGIDIYRKWIVATATVVFRSSVVESELYLSIKNAKELRVFDTPLFILCSQFGKLRALDICASVYRRHAGGVTNAFSSNIYEMLKHDIFLSGFFGKEYIEICKRKNAGLIIVAIKNLSKDFGRAFKLFCLIICYAPLESLTKLVTFGVKYLYRS